MWRMTPRLAIATLTATMALATATAPRTQAAAVQSYAYDTSGSISGPTGSPITFQPETSTSSFTTPGTVYLGQFFTNPLPTTATLTYNNTPFTIDLNVGASNPSNASGAPVNAYQYVISGVLNGTIGGDGSSSMFATITSITGSGSGATTSPPFPISDLLISTQGIAAPSGDSQGITTLTGLVTVAGLPISGSSTGPGNPQLAPEPSTVAVFGLALAGWAGHRRSRSKAKGAKA